MNRIPHNRVLRPLALPIGMTLELGNAKCDDGEIDAAPNEQPVVVAQSPIISAIPKSTLYLINRSSRPSPHRRQRHRVVELALELRMLNPARILGDLRVDEVVQLADRHHAVA